MPSYSFGQSVNYSISLAFNNDQTVPRRTKMVVNMLEGIEVRCGVEYKEPVAAELDIAAKTIHSGPNDALPTEAQAKRAIANKNKSNKAAHGTLP